MGKVVASLCVLVLAACGDAERQTSTPDATSADARATLDGDATEATDTRPSDAGTVPLDVLQDTVGDASDTRVDNDVDITTQEDAAPTDGTSTDIGDDSGACEPNVAPPWQRRIRPAGCAVVFNELGGHGTLEWLELYNPLVVDVDLSDWRIQGRVSHRFAPGTFILARSYLVVSAPFERSDDTTRALSLTNNMGRTMDVMDPGDAPLWPTPSADQALAKRDPETLSALAESWLAAPPTPGAANMSAGPSARTTLVDEAATWRFDDGGVAAAGWSTPSFDDGAWPSGAAPFSAGASGDTLTARVSADNYFAAYLGAADGSEMRYVGRDSDGNWQTPEDLSLSPAPGDHLYLAAWESAGSDGGPQMLIGELSRAGVTVAATSTSAFEWRLGPSDAAPADPSSPPPAASIGALAAGPFATPAASLDKGGAPWGGTLGASFAAASFIWGDTFDAVSQTNSNTTYALFRTRDPIATSAGATIDPVPTTTFFRHHFDFAGDPRHTRLWLTLEADNGAVVYLNGAELQRQNLPAGPLADDTSASAAGATRATLIVPCAALQTGDNVIAVAVHQFTGTSAEQQTLRFALALAAEPVTPTTTPRDGDLVINEIMYHPLDPAAGSASDWLELYNRGADTLDLSGWQLVDALAYTFPAGATLGPGEYLVLAQDADAMARDYPGVPVFGTFAGGLASDGERVALLDGCGATVDAVRYRDGGRWPSDADGAASSLELRDPFADNARPEAWAASHEEDRAGWQTIRYRGVANASAVGPDGRWPDIVIGLLDEGVVLLDDISVIANPDTGNATELIRNGTFESSQPDWQVDWNAIGTHEQSDVVVDPDDPSNHVLRLVATGPTEHMHNQLVTPTRDARTIDNGTTYEISLRARWVAGSDQLNTRLYFNRLAKTTRLGRPLAGGTPGRRNGTAVDDLGPTFHDLHQSPLVPRSSDSVLVSIGVDDPDDVDTVTLFAGPDGAPLVAYPMTASGGAYEAVLPPAPSGTIVQLYVVAQDGSGVAASYPPRGPASRALYRVDDSPGPTALHSLRIIMTAADAVHFYAPTNVMSNAATPVTVVYDDHAYYDIGVRAKGSERGRPTNARIGFSLRFDADDPFRGVLDSLSIDRSEGGGGTGQREMMIDQVMAHAGSVSAEYNDLVQLVAPRPEHSGQACMQTSRFTNLMLANQFEDGSDGALYEYELVYYPLQTDDGSVTGLKLPQPDSVVGTALRDLGDDPESYRQTFLVKNNRGRDDFTELMQMCKVFGESDSQFRADVTNVIDVDEWLRAYAFMSLSGASDNYGAGSQHNAQLYVRPSDGRVLLFPHDLDLYPGSPQSAIVGNNDLARMLAIPGKKRVFYGTLYDLLQGAHSPAYLDRWRTLFNAILPGQDFTSHYDFMVARRDWILDGAGDAIHTTFPALTFAITTNGGQPLTTSDASVTLDGVGWIDVSDIVLDLDGDTFPLVVTWTDETHWRVALSLAAGAHTLTLEAHDAHGASVGSDSITVTVTP